MFLLMKCLLWSCTLNNHNYCSQAANKQGVDAQTAKAQAVKTVGRMTLKWVVFVWVCTAGSGMMACANSNKPCWPLRSYHAIFLAGYGFRVLVYLNNIKKEGYSSV